MSLISLVNQLWLALVPGDMIDGALPRSRHFSQTRPDN